MTKGDVTRDDSQRRFLAQHGVEMLEQCCNHSKQCRNNVATPCCAKNRRCESSRVTSPLRPSYTLILWRNCRMCLQKILFPVFMFAFIFSLLLIFTWPLTFLINYRTTAMKVTCFSSNEIRLASSFSVVHVSLNIKNNVEKDTTLLRFSSVAFGLPYLLIISNVTNNEIAWISSDCFESFSPLSNVWIDRPLMPPSDVITTRRPGRGFDWLIV